MFVYLRRKNTILGNRRCFFASSDFSPLSPWQAWSLPQARSWSYAVTPLPLRAGDSVWPVSPSYSRQRSIFRKCRLFPSPHPGQTEWCAPPDEPREKMGGGENSAVAGDVPAAARLFPFLSRTQCTIPQDAPASSGTSCSRGHKDTLNEIPLRMLRIPLQFVGVIALSPIPKEIRVRLCRLNLRIPFAFKLSYKGFVRVCLIGEHHFAQGHGIAAHQNHAVVNVSSSITSSPTDTLRASKNPVLTGSFYLVRYSSPCTIPR